jgi:hypothetical protein
MGHVGEAPEESVTEPQRVNEFLFMVLHNPHADLVDLRFLLIERGLWQQAARQSEWAQSLLAKVYAEHAHYLSLYERWGEVKILAQRALDLIPTEEATTPNYALRAVLKLAAAEVYGGNRLAPERGFQRIKAWLSRSSDPEFTSWILSDMGKYLAMAGQTETALELGEQAIAAAADGPLMRQLDQGQLLLLVGQPDRTLDQLPALPPREGALFVYEALTRSAAYLTLDAREEASGWLAQAYAVIEAEGLKSNRIQADALARRF